MMIGTVESFDLKRGKFTLRVKEAGQEDLVIRCVITDKTLLNSNRFTALLDDDNIALEGSLRTKIYKTALIVGYTVTYYVEVHDIFKIPKQ